MLNLSESGLTGYGGWAVPSADDPIQGDNQTDLKGPFRIIYIIGQRQVT